MPLFSIKLPPGMSRPGTVYDAKGRWFTGSLVRWFEGVMQPVGGWQVLNRTVTRDVDACLSDDGGVFTDETADANDPGAGDVVLLPATPNTSDFLYVGFEFPFAEVDFVITVAASTNNIINKNYWNGTAWVSTIGNLTGTSVGGNPWQQSGTDVHVPQADWAKTTVDGKGPFYYLRWGTVAAGTSGATAATVDIGTGPVRVPEPPRGTVAWRTNASQSRLAFGTASELFILGEGDLNSVTPSGFTTGGVDAVQSSGNYGAGAYGVGPYGTGDDSQVSTTEANTWQMDNHGEDLVACAFSDGKIYVHDTSAGASGLATVLTNAPTDNRGVVVTPERFVVALGSQGDRRQVSWADVDDRTDWVAVPNNQAGDLILPGKGEILAGRRTRSETLIWTDVDLFAMRFIGGEFVYQIPQVGSNCGAVSRHAMQVVDGQAFWMGHRGFFQYNGFVKPLPSEVGDFVFNDINQVQVSKIWCDSRAAYGEVTWYYPSGGSTECDKYVTYNHRGGFWYFGDLERTAGADRGAFGTSMAADASGVWYQHETGTSYLDPAGVTLVPNAESGPVEIGDGDTVMTINDLVPDGKTLGGLDISIFTAPYPLSTETENGPFTAAEPTSVRLTARQVRLKVVQSATGWRLGTLRLDVTSGGRR